MRPVTGLGLVGCRVVGLTAGLAGMGLCLGLLFGKGDWVEGGRVFELVRAIA